jgi:hypothetical protein
MLNNKTGESYDLSENLLLSLKNTVDLSVNCRSGETIAGMDTCRKERYTVSKITITYKVYNRALTNKLIKII